MLADSKKSPTTKLLTALWQTCSLPSNVTWRPSGLASQWFSLSQYFTSSTKTSLFHHNLSAIDQVGSIKNRLAHSIQPISLRLKQLSTVSACIVRKHGWAFFFSSEQAEISVSFYSGRSHQAHVRQQWAWHKTASLCLASRPDKQPSACAAYDRVISPHP